MLLTADGIRAELTRLQAAEFLYEVRLFPDLEYTFKHALTHEVAYSGLLYERRRDLHGPFCCASSGIHCAQETAYAQARLRGWPAGSEKAEAEAIGYNTQRR